MATYRKRTDQHEICYEVENLELIGPNETVDQDKWGGSVQLVVSSARATGDILSATLIATQDGTGAILRNAIDIVIFRDDPSISPNTTLLSKANGNLVQGIIPVVAADWIAASSGTDVAGVAHVDVDTPFMTSSDGDLYVACVNRGATSYNSAAGDDEQLEVTFILRIDD